MKDEVKEFSQTVLNREKTMQNRKVKKDLEKYSRFSRLFLIGIPEGWNKIEKKLFKAREKKIPELEEMSSPQTEFGPVLSLNRY